MEEKILEQPDLETENKDAYLASANQDGSNIGKFKDAQSLLDAYNALEAEFTRKSQKLAEFQKENEKNAVFEIVEDIDEILKDETIDKEKYKKEITEIVSENNLDSLPNKYQIAFKMAKTIEQKTSNALNDAEFMDNYIKQNDNLKQQIISDYLSTLNNISQIPKVISGNASTIHVSNTTSIPRTFKEAGEIFYKMLK